ncbi:MAG: TetR/AcrR family transcriptional regulator, partial [Anaerolineae bacterium]
MTESAPSKREQLRQERRRQILEAALAVFTQKGYHATNVSDVAAQAGVSQGTIYWYFESKDELFQAAILLAFEDFGEAALGSLDQYPTATEKLTAMARAMEQFADVAEGIFMLFLSYWASSEQREESAQIWIELLQEYKGVVVAVIDEG